MEATNGIMTYWRIVMAGQQWKSEGMCKVRLSDHLDKYVRVKRKDMQL